jgi:hypothetical protein
MVGLVIPSYSYSAPAGKIVSQLPEPYLTLGVTMNSPPLSKYPVSGSIPGFQTPPFAKSVGVRLTVLPSSNTAVVVSSSVSRTSPVFLFSTV